MAPAVSKMLMTCEPGMRGERVAEAGDVDAEQLQLRAHVEAREDVVAAAEIGDRRPRHLVAGRDQAVAAALVRRAFADRVDRGVGGARALIDHDAAALADQQIRGARQLVARADARREDDRVDVQLGAVREPQRAHAPVGAHDLAAGRRRVDDDADLLDALAENGAARVVELQRHQPRRQLDDVRLHPQLLQRVRRLEPQQAAADHGAGAARVVGRPGGDRLQVLDGAVDEAAGQIAPGNGRHERRRAGREDQVVVRDLAAVDLDDPARAIDAPRARREADREAGGLVLPGTRQREILRRLAVEERRQADAIVGEPRLLAEHRHVERRPPGRGDPLPEKLEEPVADHAVADDDQSIATTALHASQPSGRPVSRWSSHGQMSVYERYR